MLDPCIPVPGMWGELILACIKKFKPRNQDSSS